MSSQLVLLELPQLFRLLAFICIQLAQASSDAVEVHRLALVSHPCVAGPPPWRMLLKIWGGGAAPCIVARMLLRGSDARRGC
jgi:hypothetical protein